MKTNKETLTQSHKLAYLIDILWKSPVFNDSFPKSNGQGNLAMAQFKAIYPDFLKTVLPILQKGMPNAEKKELNSIIEEIAPKSIAFCASISAGEIESKKHLSHAAVAIFLSYWADQSMDRGDEMMFSAVQYLNHQSITTKITDTETFRARLEALQHIQHLASQITLPEDLPYAQQAIERDVLGLQAKMRILSHKFKESQVEFFWAAHAEEVAQTMTDCSGLMSAVSIIYAIYRKNNPELPSLNEIYSHPKLMQLIRGTFNTAVRIFDDAGDYYTDTGQDPNWGDFNLNIFNQAHPALLKAFLNYSHISENDPLYTEFLSAFSLPISGSRITVSTLYLKLVRERVNALSPTLTKKYSLFITLSKRTLEAGFVNILGDVFLSENTHLSALDIEFFKLLVPDSAAYLTEQEITL